MTEPVLFADLWEAYQKGEYTPRDRHNVLPLFDQMNREEKPMLKLNDVRKAHAEAGEKLSKQFGTLEDAFDDYVMKQMQPDETFEAAYSRLLSTKAGREFYDKRQTLKVQDATVNKMVLDAIRAGHITA